MCEIKENLVGQRDMLLFLREFFYSNKKPQLVLWFFASIIFYQLNISPGSGTMLSLLLLCFVLIK